MFIKTETQYVDGKTVKETKTLGVGTTLAVGNETVQVMSDIWETAQYAEYWDEEEEAVRRSLWIDRGVVDATPEVLAKVKEYFYKRNYVMAQNDALNRANKIVKESVVRVTRGKRDVGLEGPVVAIIERPYRAGYRVTMENMLGIPRDDEKIEVQVGRRTYQNYKNMSWVWARNCELAVIPPIDVDGVAMLARGKTQSDMRRYEQKAA